MYSSGWLNQNENLSSAIHTIPKVFVTRNSFFSRSTCLLRSVLDHFSFLRYPFANVKTSLLPSPVNWFRTSFAISTPLKAWGRPGNNPSLPLQLRESTLLCGHLHASAMHTVHRMVSNNPPPPNTYLKNSQTSGSLLWSKSLHKHLRCFLSSGVKASWWYIWLTSPTRATNFFRNLTRILNSSVCNFGPGNAWLF